MRRLTIWITATLAVVALVIAYQLNATGVGGKGGDEGNHGVAPQACASAQCPASATSVPSSAPSGPGTSSPASPEKSSDDRGTSTQTAKPGENK